MTYCPSVCPKMDYLSAPPQDVLPQVGSPGVGHSKGANPTWLHQGWYVYGATPRCLLPNVCPKVVKKLPTQDGYWKMANQGGYLKIINSLFWWAIYLSGLIYECLLLIWWFLSWFAWWPNLHPNNYNQLTLCFGLDYVGPPPSSPC